MAGNALCHDSCRLV